MILTNYGTKSRNLLFKHSFAMTIFSSVALLIISVFVPTPMSVLKLSDTTARWQRISQVENSPRKAARKEITFWWDIYRGVFEKPNELSVQKLSVLNGYQHIHARMLLTSRHRGLLVTDSWQPTASTNVGIGQNEQATGDDPSLMVWC
jgi:hypothetical protein